MSPLVLRGILPAAWLACVLVSSTVPARADATKFLEQHCYACHNAETSESNLDLTSLPPDFADRELFQRWVKIHDRIASGEMPPKSEARPAAEDVQQITSWLSDSLLAAEKSRFEAEGRTIVRRLTRVEYENTMRDLFEMSGIALQGNLPADGSAHGFDKNSDALDISHVNLLKYVEAADHALNLAIATQPFPPELKTQRISLARNVGHILGNGDAVLLRDMKPDPEYPPAANQHHVDQGAHEQIGSFERFSSVGVFRHEDESFNPYFLDFSTIYPGRYRVKVSFWSFQWDKGEVLPARGTEAARLSAVQLANDGRHGGHPSYVIGYYDAPSLDPKVHEFEHWFNYKETIGFNTASLAPAVNYSRKGRAMAFTGPGIACDYLTVEGPLHDIWPPPAHRVLFGDLPLVQFNPHEQKETTWPRRVALRQEVGAARNRPDAPVGNWTVQSDQPLVDADRLLATFLPKAFRRPVSDEVRQSYVAQVDSRLKAGDCFELAMRWVYRAALCSPDFLYHVELPADAQGGEVDNYALANRLSYFFWNSLPDAQLTDLAAAGKLRQPEVLDREIERMLKDAKSQRFVDDFLGQWLKLRSIAATDPDRKLYPEFSAYLQDSMVAETRGYFRELLEQNLDASHLIRSDFVVINEKLATHYGIPGVSGSQVRRVALPAGCPRGGFLTQAAILKITANGTTTSPVPRGAFVMDRLLGQPPDPPPPNIAAIEPDVRGASTIREQLSKHRDHTVCASCHARMDPPGFAMECFDVIGGLRARYRSIGEGDTAERGSIDPFIGISFKLGPPVDASGKLLDERTFTNITEFQALLANETKPLLTNLAGQLAVYSTGRDVAFGDRPALSAVVTQTEQQGGGIRTLIHELVRSELFRKK